MTRARTLPAVTIAALLIALTLPAPALTGERRADPSLFGGLHWRNVGPFRGGRVVAVAGVAGDARTFYFGAVGGGVWKTTNAGTTWAPIMDGQGVASIGALAVARSDAATVYAGSGEADMRSDIIHGNGVYRSRDAGATWTHVGLDDSRQIGKILVDPADAKTLLVAALGHAYGPNDTRGVYRSTDGGATWTRTLARGSDTGAIDLAADPKMHVVYASLWQTRRPPWSVYPPSNGPGSGLYKSTDGGVTWTALTGNGFPAQGLGKVGLAVAPSMPARVYAIVDAKAGGLYRSDDAGATWRLINREGRLWQRGWYFCHVSVDPKNPDLVYVSDTSLYRSTNGGATFASIKGSPDGDDMHALWIDPTEPRRMILGSDQGATISVDGAATWSSWFNQPTGQFYHVATDDAFPYRLYGSQQDSGAARVPSRSTHRGIEERDWTPIGALGESGAGAPDPEDANVVYGTNPVVREDVRTGEQRAIAPTTGRPGTWRSEWTMPIAFGTDGALYTSNQGVWRSRDRGAHWQSVSGDLTRRHPPVPATLDGVTAGDADTPQPRGVVYALAPSPLRATMMWAGTDDGLIWRTSDGTRTWRNVTPPALTPWSHVDAIEASHDDPQTAYVAVDRHRLDDDRPSILITHDGGRTWREAVAGIDAGAYVHVVREDTRVRGLLYAGTEHGVFVSFDDGASWRPLRLNMPVVPVHDIAVHGDDLAIATHGRAFWILDDIAPLRAAASGTAPVAGLIAPVGATRTQPYSDEAEASPPEVPMGENAPYGAPIDYVVPAHAAGPLSLAIVDARGTTLRTWSSGEVAASPDPRGADYPAYWLQAEPVPSAAPGTHRFFWNLRTARADDAPLAPPGRYMVRLTLDGRRFERVLVVRRDPRVRATDADLAAQYALARAVFALRAQVTAAIAVATAARNAHPADAARIDAVAGAPPVVDPRNSEDLDPRTFATLRGLEALLADLLGSVESADAAPTRDERAAWAAVRPQATARLAAWNAMRR